MTCPQAADAVQRFRSASRTGGICSDDAPPLRVPHDDWRFSSWASPTLMKFRPPTPFVLLKRDTLRGLLETSVRRPGAAPTFVRRWAIVSAASPPPHPHSFRASSATGLHPPRCDATLHECCLWGGVPCRRWPSLLLPWHDDGDGVTRSARLALSSSRSGLPPAASPEVRCPCLFPGRCDCVCRRPRDSFRLCNRLRPLPLAALSPTPIALRYNRPRDGAGAGALLRSRWHARAL